MDTIMDNVSCLLAQHSEILKGELTKKMNLNEKDIHIISSVLDESRNLFEGISTDALQKSFIKSSFLMLHLKK